MRSRVAVSDDAPGLVEHLPAPESDVPSTTAARRACGNTGRRATCESAVPPGPGVAPITAAGRPRSTRTISLAALE